MSVPPTWPQVLDFFGTPIVIEPSPGQLSSDAGLLSIRQFDERIGLTQRPDFLDKLATLHRDSFFLAFIAQHLLVIGHPTDAASV
jgi:hypothetical protein